MWYQEKPKKTSIVSQITMTVIVILGLEKIPNDNGNKTKKNNRYKSSDETCRGLVYHERIVP
jgi:hypothetical protein